MSSNAARHWFRAGEVQERVRRVRVLHIGRRGAQSCGIAAGVVAHRVPAGPEDQGRREPGQVRGEQRRHQRGGRAAGRVLRHVPVVVVRLARRVERPVRLRVATEVEPRIDEDLTVDRRATGSRARRHAAATRFAPALWPPASSRPSPPMAAPGRPDRRPRRAAPSVRRHGGGARDRRAGHHRRRDDRADPVSAAHPPVPEARRAGARRRRAERGRADRPARLPSLPYAWSHRRPRLLPARPRWRPALRRGRCGRGRWPGPPDAEGDDGRPGRRAGQRHPARQLDFDVAVFGHGSAVKGHAVDRFRDLAAKSR